MNLHAKPSPFQDHLSKRPSAGGHADTSGRSGGVDALALCALSDLHARIWGGTVSDAVRQSLGSPVTAALANALCDEDDDTADLIVFDMIDAGVSVEEVCLDHLAAAARRLGEMWDTDRLPFTEVALASARIQSILRRLPPARMPVWSGRMQGAVFCAVPGEAHTLGVMMAADLFRRSGWDVGLLLGLEHDDIVARLENDDRSVIGLSCSGSHSWTALMRLIDTIRDVRPDAHLMVSGQIATQPERVAALPPVDALVACFADAQAEMARLEAGLRV